MDATLAICKKDGPQVLLAGLGPTVAGYGIEGAMKFGVYEVMKPIFSSLLGGDENPKSKGVAFLLASIVAGAVAAVLLCPMESTRIRIVTDKDYKGKGLLTGLPKLMKDEGILSTFSGIWAMLAKQVCTTIFVGTLVVCVRRLFPTILTMLLSHCCCFRFLIRLASKFHSMFLQACSMLFSTNTATTLLSSRPRAQNGLFRLRLLSLRLFLLASCLSQAT